MLTQQHLKDQAYRLLPRGSLRDEFFRRRRVLRCNLAAERKVREYDVRWDDPEFAACTALLLAELVERPGTYISGMASG